MELETDPLKLRQIATNLISNAIRYTESGSVDVVCQVNENDRWSIVVADTGIGISPEAQAQIFEPYFRAAAQNSESLNSTGLGLAIVDRLVKLLQGEIEFSSELGKGSVFTVTLPTNITPGRWWFK